MSAPPNKGKGNAIAFLRYHIAYQGDDCLIWPFCRIRGYGIVSIDGENIRAHRLMCEMVHGPAPSEDHEAAHSCGNGHGGCVNPRHLSWKTRIANQADRKKHGTAGRRNERLYKLTPEKVAEIRARSGTMTVTDLADAFGVTRSTIRQIQVGKIWREGTKFPRQFTSKEVATIKALGAHLSCKEIAVLYGVRHQVIWRIQNGRAYTAPSSLEQRGERKDG